TGGAQLAEQADREEQRDPLLAQQRIWLTERSLKVMVSYGEEQRDPLLAQQRHEMAVVEGELAYNEAVIEEREQGIQEIQQQIVEVNEIFQDLAVLVREQGGMIGESRARVSL
ncbi:unnamed protein product, partial [Closterium sp. NIES-53]